MRKLIMLTLIIVLGIFATACDSSDTIVDDNVVTTVQKSSSKVNTTSDTINVDYENALTLRNQLNLGILKLEDNPDLAITPEQATQLIGLWQGLTALTKSGTGATVEVDAMLNQIENTLTDEQRQAIVDMHLVQDDIQAVAQAWGLSIGNGSAEPGVTRGQGAGKNMSETERAAREAERSTNGGSPSGGGGMSVALYDRLIQLLEDRAN